MKRRTLLAVALTTAAGLILPYEPQTIYSFPSQEFLNRPKVHIRSVDFQSWSNDRLVLEVKANIVKMGKTRPIELYVLPPFEDPKLGLPESHDKLKEAILYHWRSSEKLLAVVTDRV